MIKYYEMISSTLQTADYPAGLYLIEVLTERGQRLTQKLIIR